jgi:hypothetical protein
VLTIARSSRAVCTPDGSRCVSLPGRLLCRHPHPAGLHHAQQGAGAGPELAAGGHRRWVHLLARCWRPLALVTFSGVFAACLGAARRLPFVPRASLQQAPPPATLPPAHANAWRLLFAAAHRALPTPRPRRRRRLPPVGCLHRRLCYLPLAAGGRGGVGRQRGGAGPGTAQYTGKANRSACVWWLGGWVGGGDGPLSLPRTPYVAVRAGLAAPAVFSGLTNAGRSACRTSRLLCCSRARGSRLGSTPHPCSPLPSAEPDRRPVPCRPPRARLWPALLDRGAGGDAGGAVRHQSGWVGVERRKMCDLPSFSHGCMCLKRAGGWVDE